MKVSAARAIGFASAEMPTAFAPQGKRDVAVNFSLKVLNDVNVTRRVICT